MTKPLVDAWSYSRFTCYEECPAKFKYRCIDKIDEGPKPPAMQRGIDIHRECEAFLKGEEQLSDNMHEFEELFHDLKSLSPMVEQKWGFTEEWRSTGWFSKGRNATWLRVIPDAAVLYEDCPEAEIIDFKTGKPYGNYDDQMNLFATATFARYPELRTVTTRLWFLDTGDEVVGTLEKKGQRDRINDWYDRVEPMFNDDKFAPTPSPRACRFCKFSRAEGGPCKF